MLRLRWFCSTKLATLAGALIFFAVCGACHKPETSAKRLANRGPLQPCMLPGIDEELLYGKLTVFENREKHPTAPGWSSNA